MKPAVCYLFSLITMLLFVVSPASADVAQFKTPLEQAHWQYSGSPFGCSLSQNISGFGSVSLAVTPGSQPKLVLHSDWLSNAGLTQAKVIASSWNSTNPQDKSVDMVWNGRTARSVGKDASRFLEALDQGYSWQIGINGSQRYRVIASPINVSEVTQAFRMCRRNILPKPFDYVRQRDILFATNSSQLSPKAESDLYAVARYVKADKRIRQILVDGYADVTGSRLANLVLSEARAQNVASRLVEFGIPTSKIEIFHHGNRDPIASDNTAAGQRLERRVTIRLVKAH